MSGTDCRHDLVAYERGELEAAAAEALSAHVAACDACSAELADIRRVLEDVRADSLTPTPAFRARLDAVLDAELARGPAGNVLSLRSRVREVWEFAQWRYETSLAVRRFVAASIVAHAAAVAVIAILLVQRAGAPPPDVHVTYLDPKTVPELTGATAPPPAVIGDPIVDAAEPGALPPAMGQRLRLVLDEKARDAHLEQALGALAPQVVDALEVGLDWLAEQQFEDGSWGAPQLDRHVRAGTTAAALMAFALHDLDAPVMGSTVAYLQRYMQQVEADEAADFGEGKPVYAYAFALRALTTSDAINHEYREPGNAKRLRRYAARLASWQRDDGGFGYTPAAARSDSSCTLFVSETLDWVRTAGLLDTTNALERAARFLTARRDDDGVLGYETLGDRGEDLGLTAALEALGSAFGLEPHAGARAAIERRLAADGPQDLLFLGYGVSAMGRAERPIRPAVEALLAARTDDGGWTDEGDQHCAGSGRELATALGVIGLARTYVN